MNRHFASTTVVSLVLFLRAPLSRREPIRKLRDVRDQRFVTFSAATRPFLHPKLASSSRRSNLPHLSRHPILLPQLRRRLEPILVPLPAPARRSGVHPTERRGQRRRSGGAGGVSVRGDSAGVKLFAGVDLAGTVVDRTCEKGRCQKGYEKGGREANTNQSEASHRFEKEERQYCLCAEM